MPIKELQQRLTQVGVIRLGEQRLSKNNKPYPAKLDTFRVTSPSKALVEAVAGLYGGEVRPWPEGPGGGQWQVTTGVTEMAVHVLPQKIDPNYELWGNGFRARLCDGETERIRNVPCFCNAEKAQCETAGRTWIRDARKHCKPTTRLSLMLSDVPSLGTWKLESHGWNAAAELPTLAVAILGQVNRPVPAVLRLEQREDRILNVAGSEEKVEPRKYAVPVLDFGELATPRQALGAGMDAVVRTAVGAAPERQAIGSASSADQPAVDPRSDLWNRARAERTLPGLRKVWEDAASAAKAGLDDPDLAAFLRQRMHDLAGEQPTSSTPEGQAAAATAEVVDAEEEPDPDVTWTRILKTGAERGWNLPAVEERYRSRMGHDPSEEAATGWKLAEFLTAVENGQVQ